MLPLTLSRALLYNVGLLMVLGSCATITTSVNQRIHISSNPKGADIYIDSVYYGTTPMKVKIRRKGHRYHSYLINPNPTVALELEGYRPYHAQLFRGYSPGILFNVLLVHPIIMGGGALIDFGTGAAYKYSPNFVEGDLLKQELEEIRKDIVALGKRDPLAKQDSSISVSKGPVRNDTIEIMPVVQSETGETFSARKLYLVVQKNDFKITGYIQRNNDDHLYIKSETYGNLLISKDQVKEIKPINQGDYSESLSKFIVSTGIGGFTPFWGWEMEALVTPHFGIAGGLGVGSFGGGGKFYLKRVDESRLNVYFGGALYYSIWSLITEWEFGNFIDPGPRLYFPIGLSTVGRKSLVRSPSHRKGLFTFSAEAGFLKMNFTESNTFQNAIQFSVKVGLRI